MRVLLLLLICLACTSSTYAGMFDGKVCYITGGTSGLGAAAAVAAAREGCKTVFTGRREEKGKAVEKLIADNGDTGMFIKCDVTKTEEVKASIDATIEKYGSLDLAFNNAGIAQFNGCQPLHMMAEDGWKQTIDVNVNGVFYSMKHEITAMLERNIKGSVVNCGSIYSFRSTEWAAAYSTSKHALTALAKTGAINYAKYGIRVNNINPAFSPSEITAGFVAAESTVPIISEWQPAGRFLKNSEVIDGLFWLWSDKSTFYNGQSLILDSGLTAGWVPPKRLEEQMRALMKALELPYPDDVAEKGSTKYDEPVLTKEEL